MQLKPGLLRTRARIWHSYLRIADRFGASLYATITFVTGLLALWFVVGVLHVGSATDVTPWVITLFSTTGVVYVARRAARQNTLLIEVTLTYILEGDRELLDVLLGRLIGGEFKSQDIAIGDRLFDTLIRICDEDDEFDRRRRIAEALPALGVINRKRAIELLEHLRDDYDDTRWGSDLRRRALEALAIPSGRHAPLWVLAPRAEVEALLHHRAQDQIFTSMAALEIAADLPLLKTKPGDPAPIDTQLASEFDHTYRDLSEREALNELEEFLRITRHSRSEGVARAKVMAESQNRSVQVAAARNLWRLASDKAAFVDLVEMFSSPERHKYVRRPIAKENSVRNLIRLVQKKDAVGDRAWSILVRLLNDPDDIIPNTAFDIVETWTNREKVCEACDIVMARTSPPELLERAERVRARNSC